MGRRQYARTHFSISLVEIEKLYREITSLIQQAHLSTLPISYLTTLNLHWNIGRLIVDAGFGRNRRMEEHQELLSQLSKRLIKKFEKEFNFFSFEDCCTFYLVYPPVFKVQRTQSENVDIPELRAPLTWDHYRLLIHVSCPKARIFYEKEASNSNWSPFLLKHFIKCRLFERLTVSASKEGVLRSAQQGSLELFSVNNNYLDKPMDKQKTTRRLYECS